MSDKTLAFVAGTVFGMLLVGAPLAYVMLRGATL